MFFRDEEEFEEYNRNYEINQRSFNRVENRNNVRLIYKHILTFGAKVYSCVYDEKTDSYAIYLSDLRVPLMLRGMV